MTIVKKVNYAEVDTTLSPIIILRIAPIEPTDEQFEGYFTALNEVMESTRKGVLILQISKAKFLSAERRIRIGTWLKENDKRLRESFVGFCYVNSAFIPMTILKGILLVNPPPVPHAVVGTEVEAINWAHEKLK